MEAKRKILLGRSSMCDFIIEDTNQHGTVSGKHATLYEGLIKGMYILEDHSTNGTYVNGQLVHNDTCEIHAGDHITLGRTYVLPLGEITERYFGGRKTTKKTISQPVSQPSPQIIYSEPLSQKKDTRPSPRVDTQPSPQPNKKPKSQDNSSRFWTIFIIIVAMVLICGLIYDMCF